MRRNDVALRIPGSDNNFEVLPGAAASRGGAFCVELEKSMGIMRCVIAAAVLGGAPLEAQVTESVRPRLRNVEELARTLRQDAPPLLQDNVLGGMVRLRLFVSDSGTVDTVRVARSSGIGALDAAARSVGRRAKFEPARANGTAVGVWVDLPLTFPRRGNATGPELVPISFENRDSVEAALQAHYPPIMRGAKIGASVGIALDLHEDGTARRAEIAHTSCFGDVDTAAMAIALGLPLPHSEAPGKERRTLLTLSFTKGDSVSLKLLGDADPPPPDSLRQRSGEEREGETRRPRLRNRSQISRALVANYPTELRDNGIGGETTIWFHVTEQGSVDHLLVSKSSGNCALDNAALTIADIMRFDPALSDGERVAVWVEIPIIFTAR